MGGWFETAAVLLTVVFAAYLGRWFSRLKTPHWGWGYVISLSLIAFLLISAHLRIRLSLPILAWATVGRARFVIVGIAVAMGSLTLVGRLTKPIERVIVLVMTLSIILWASIMPFLVPTLIKNELTNIKTRLDSDNICVQSTDYTCGPAAAVTALRLFGLPAQEGELAILSHTSPVTGTLPWDLYKAIQNRYPSANIDCRLRQFDSVNQLRDADATLVVVNDSLLLDHCVVVLDVGDKFITIADPAVGRYKLTRKTFENIWRFYGITLKRNPS
jgi:predicted double-glycine peptidase